MAADRPDVELEATLDDGLRILFRPIRPDDKDLLVRGFEQLSPESRYRRFFRHLDRLSERELRYLTEIDFENHFAWVALVDDPSTPGVGVVRWIRLADEPDVAEAAVTVIDPYQHRGIGRMLMWLGAMSAIEHGIRAIKVYTLGDNRPVLEMLRDAAVERGQWQSGVMEASIPLPPTLDQLEQSPFPLLLRSTARGTLGAELLHDATRAGIRLSTPTPLASPEANAEVSS